MAIYRVCTICRTVWQIGAMKNPPRRYECPECAKKRMASKPRKNAE